MSHNLSKLSQLTLLCAAALSFGASANDGTRLLGEPDISSELLTFVYGGDIWVSQRDGSQPRQMTTHAAHEFAPKFSPDGKWIAFSASYDNNTDVYVMPASGGQATRLTWHPSADIVNGWSPDGKKIVFASNREVLNSRSNQLFEVAVSGGYEEKVMTAVAFEGDFHADGNKLAYRPNNMAYSGSSGWRLHRGGSTPPIWIIDLKQQTLEKVPHPNANEHNPFWLGDDVYFLSDRDNVAMNLYRYRNQKVEQLTQLTNWDIGSASGHGDTIVYEAGGALYQFDAKRGSSKPIAVSLKVAGPQTRPQWKDASKTLTSARLSSTGQRVLVSARGDVFTVPVKDGSTRNITQTSGVREFASLWSADGQRIAYLRDDGSEQQLVISNQAGDEVLQTLDLGPQYYQLMAWSADNNRIVYSDNHLNLFVYDVAANSSQKIGSSERRSDVQVSFSPDSRYLAYTAVGANYFSQIYLYDLTNNTSRQLTDGLSHADNPVFNADYLFFTASVNTGPSQVGLDLSTQERPVRKGIYAMVLRQDGQSPLHPKTGDEPQQDDNKDDDSAAEFRIDSDGLLQRIVGLPIAERNYANLAVADDGALLFLQYPQPGSSNEPPGANGAGATLMRFDFSELKASELTAGILDFNLSADGKTLLTVQPGGRLQVGTVGAKAELKAVNMADVRSYVNPREEWQHIFADAWRMQQQYFYDPNMHGMNWQAVYDKYQPLLKHLQRREDLNQLLVQMIAELQVGHNRIGGGDVHQEGSSKVGLLGADFRVVDNRYQLATVYQGDRWSPYLQAPLATPGASAKAGEFIIAINGQQLTAAQNIFAALDNSQGKQLTLTLSSHADGRDARDITVTPTANESQLRLWHWVESNRQQVEEASDGQLAYVYLPNTAGGGFYFFNRMFFAQVDKPALIIDERKNGGGQAANYITEILARPFLSGWKDRDGLTFSTPGGVIAGPKTMLIDQDAGSGGDFLPWSFKRLGLGKTIGTRTWGGLIGISTNPAMIDGGFHVVPFFRFYTPDGEWRVENEGVAPDIEVELDPILVNQGRDSQLERAIAETLQQLRANPPADHSKAPAMPTKLGL